MFEILSIITLVGNRLTPSLALQLRQNKSFRDELVSELVPDITAAQKLSQVT
jgi:hypothetical protein